MSPCLWKGPRLKHGSLFQVVSGSPLICEGIFRGVSSFRECCGPKKPGVYTLLIPKYLNWIRKTMAGAAWPSFLQAENWGAHRRGWAKGSWRSTSRPSTLGCQGHSLFETFRQHPVLSIPSSRCPLRKSSPVQSPFALFRIWGLSPSCLSVKGRRSQEKLGYSFFFK